MSEQTAVRKREVWVDEVKVIACILVVLGHFFQSMTKANILPENDLYKWFNTTIYYFHVPLFFICSGYLYQKYSKVNSFRSWKKNVAKKALALGVPYVTFSIATWVLKTVFSGSVNDQIGGLGETLLLHPTAPYWYLYALFFIFLVTPTFSTVKMAATGLAVAVVAKVYILTGGGTGIYAVSTVLINEIWFVIGMSICAFNVQIRGKKLQGTVIGLLFLGLSVAVVYMTDGQNSAVSFVLGLMACAAVILLVADFEEKSGKAMGFLARYTMPIFLMHTLFAAPLRSVLLKIGISNTAIHVVLGLGISFAGPIVAAWIMKKSKWMEFFLYPITNLQKRNKQMKEVLYISNVEVPYRNEFFNQLALKCNLTVLYEKSKSTERDEKWTKSIERKYEVKYLDGVHISGDNYFSIKIFKYIFGKYDAVIIGCYNSPVQSLAICAMRLLRKKYVVNLDGEIYLSGNPMKLALKKWILKGATHYLVAGNSVRKALEKIVDCKIITSYPFSSLTDEEIAENGVCQCEEREGILVVGQYYDYKGLDIAVEVAKRKKELDWKFVGIGWQTERFCEEQEINGYTNIKVVPFLDKAELYKEYQKCRVLVLPSRQECWGLVVNEAASFGTPIVATWGSGAAVEFLRDSKYKKFLAKACDAIDLERKIVECISEDANVYGEYLIKKSKCYSIEKCVESYMKVIDAERS